MSGFNFQSFLVKMREKSAFGLVTEIKEFIAEHSKQKLLADEFVEIIRSFLEETNEKVAQHELWRDCSHDELDNASEGLEKYLMNKMYKACFQPSSSDDALRDQALAERLSLLSFVRPEHLDIPPGLCEDKAISMAVKELCKMDTYKAPRDKMVCVLNCCKIINNILQSHKEEAGADEFFPMLVYITLMAKPPNLHSNIKFIERFRSQDKLSGEAGYYFTNLHGAMTFAQKMSADKLTITQEQFDAELNKALLLRDEQQRKEEEMSMLDQATATLQLVDDGNNNNNNTDNINNLDTNNTNNGNNNNSNNNSHGVNTNSTAQSSNCLIDLPASVNIVDQPLQASLIDLPGILHGEQTNHDSHQDAVSLIPQQRMSSSAPLPASTSPSISHVQNTPFTDLNSDTSFATITPSFVGMPHPSTVHQTSMLPSQQQQHHQQQQHSLKVPCLQSRLRPTRLFLHKSRLRSWGRRRAGVITN
eukprot:m.216372 g.216372  ORF g.216372 m.216372 type:complete len:475 (-) comp33207_c3_seq1:448-1872(-)